MGLQPLPQAVLTAHKLREEAKRLELLADELEASVKVERPKGSGVFLYGEVVPRKIKLEKTK